MKKTVKRRTFLAACCAAVLFAAAFLVLLVRSRPAKNPPDAADPLPYDYNVVDAWDNSLAQLRTKADLAFFGDSLTRLGDFDRYFPDHTVCNLGLNGDTLAGMAARADMLSAVSPDRLFVMGGINSLRPHTLERSVREYEILLSRIASACSAETYVLSVLPVSARVIAEYNGDPDVIVAFNEEIRSLAERNGCTYIDLFSLFVADDGFIRPELTLGGVHLTEEGYRIFTDALRPFID